MLVVNVEMWPFGDERAARKLHRVCIANVGGSTKIGQYVVSIDGEPSGEVKDYPRELGAVELLRRALDASLLPAAPAKGTSDE